MRKMKDSGFSWIGQIPCEWSMKRVKHAFYRKNEKAMQYNPIVLSLARSGVHERDISNNEGQIAESYYNYNPVDIDDLLINPMDLYSGANCSISKVTGVISPAYINLRYKDGINPAFFDYYFKLQYWQMAFFSYGKGVSYENRWTLTVDTLMNYPIVIPSYSEQCAITTYLDTKCEKIDSIIARQQEVIEKLKAYKLSVITETVTKGLNPDVRMKDSGVEWIGDVPEHWELIRLKFLLANIVDCPHETPNYSFEAKYHVIRTADQELGSLRSDDNMYRLDEEEYQKRIRRLSLDKDDIVYGREGERWGLACIVPESDKYCLGQRMMQFRCNTKLIIPKFAMWALNSKYVYLQGSVDTIGSTSPHVNISTMRNYFIPTPPMEEQSEIMNYLDKKCSAIDSAIAKKQAIIEKLVVYKKSLIYEVVTGKREVKGSDKLTDGVYAVFISPDVKSYAESLLFHKIINMAGKNLKGRTHLMKIFHAVEIVIGFDFGTQYIRHIHGPYSDKIESLEKDLIDKGWLTVKKGKHIEYSVLDSSAYETDYNKYFKNYDSNIRNIVNCFLTMKRTSKAEKFATLLASWNDFIIDGVEPTDEMIINDVRTNWTENKANTNKETWQEILKQIKKTNIIPRGYGKHTVRKDN